MAAGALDLEVDALLEAAAVLEAGERVGVGGVGEAAQHPGDGLAHEPEHDGDDHGRADDQQPGQRDSSASSVPSASTPA